MYDYSTTFNINSLTVSKYCSSLISWFLNSFSAEISILAELDWLDFDTWAHGLVKRNNMTRKQYYNTSIIMRQVLHYAVAKKIVTHSEFDNVKVSPELFRKTPKPPSET